MVYSKSTSTYPYSWHQYSNNHTYSVLLCSLNVQRNTQKIHKFHWSHRQCNRTQTFAKSTCPSQNMALYIKDLRISVSPASKPVDQDGRTSGVFMFWVESLLDRENFKLEIQTQTCNKEYIKSTYIFCLDVSLLSFRMDLWSLLNLKHRNRFNNQCTLTHEWSLENMQPQLMSPTD